ncbi:RNA-dependent RNA polymerase 1 [Nephila pilipes]|uniref:RNA-dependent RNA polymerase n=1 Tax=Nephila pilipes TaxID=299642 RepID=A0A8X6TVZ7_NEPPI|nr:RNA-dependent RNA polymerase 1 [Nephila pilipes]
MFSKKRLQMKPYVIQHVRQLKKEDFGKHMNCPTFMLESIKNETMADNLIFSDELTLHISGKDNRCNSRIWGMEKPSTAIEYGRDSAKVNVFCAISSRKLYSPFFFCEGSVTSNVYLYTLEVWLMSQLATDSLDYIFQQDGAPTHWGTAVRTFLNQHLQKRWVAQSGDADDVFCSWLQRSPNLTPCNFYIWGYVKDRVSVLSLQIADMIDFLCTYIQNDNIGVLAHAHLAWADVHPEGIFSKVCMEIAKKYPLVLDFAKSGFTCYLGSGEKPKLYPDFMEKGAINNSYKSKNALGFLYRAVRNLEACVSKVDVMNLERELDENLIYPGWENYRESAEEHRREYTKRVNNILKKYGLRCEAEALTGYIGKMNEYTENRYERDNAFSIARTYVMDAIKRFRLEFFKASDNESRANKVRGKDLQEIKFRRASAWYIVTYSNKDTKVLSFPWILHDLLCEIREKNLKTKKLLCSMPNSSFIKSSDENFLQMRHKYQSSLNDRCYCVLILLNSVQEWMTKSMLNLTMSARNTFCMTCFNRIISNFMESCEPKCCYFHKSSCNCSSSCSPTKLILEFLKFYATEVSPDVDKCNEYTNGNCCKGIQALNLQSSALRSYASLAITKDTHYLGLGENVAATLDDNPNEEGDPIRVSVTGEFEYLFTHHTENVIAFLKAMSGVKDIFTSAEKDPKGNWFLLVQSIGKGWQRWNLEELIMDENVVDMLRSRLNQNL